MSVSYEMQLICRWLKFVSRARTFMRSVASEDSVGLLLFDEPSASLDPTAEHGESQ